ncbi:MULTISPECIES: restriction endonuclease subunit R [unclassified Microcoleus]|uniref:restriction endonuclease subunit R n=1 Tax=unclassified Microcoleus TaxID=2642155 RepID=UPI002FCFF8F1
MQKLQARDINIPYLIDNYGLQRVRNQEFFREWQENLPEVTDSEKQLLDRVQNIYFNLVDSPPVLENAVKLTIVSPILFIAGLFESPFQVKAEKSIAIQEEDEGRIIEGRIDILIMKANLWVTVIESKQLAFSTDEALAQLLTYMLADPNPETPTFGMIATGANFTFVKLVRGEYPQYALSNQFTIPNIGNELYRVLQILKRLSQLPD